MTIVRIDLNQQVRTRQVRAAHRSSGIQRDFGGTNAILYKERFHRAAVEQVHTVRVFARLQLHLAVAEKGDGVVAEGLARIIRNHMGKVAGNEMNVAILHVGFYERFALHSVGEVGRTDGDPDVIVVVQVQLGALVRAGLHAIYTNVIVGEHKVVQGLVIDRCRTAAAA